MREAPYLHLDAYSDYGGDSKVPVGGIMRKDRLDGRWKRTEKKRNPVIIMVRNVHQDGGSDERGKCKNETSLLRKKREKSFSLCKWLHN